MADIADRQGSGEIASELPSKYFVMAFYSVLLVMLNRRALPDPARWWPFQKNGRPPRSS